VNFEHFKSVLRRGAIQVVGNHRYRRFAVLCNLRTGSNLLLQFLRSHPAVREYGELFYDMRPEEHREAWATVFFGRVPFDGFHFTATITHKDFSKSPPKPAYDTLEIYASLDDVEAYADDDLIGQQLIDASTVLLNGNRVRLDLAAQ